MICPGCNRPARSEVDRTIGADLPIEYITRMRRCLGCGHTGRTLEMWAVQATGGLPAGYGQVTGGLPVAVGPEMLPARYRRATGSLPVAAGGVGGGLSTDPVSGSVSDLHPDPIQQSGSGSRARARGPRRLAEYSPEFLAFWAAYPKKTGKGKAWEAWQRAKPPLDRVIAALGWQVQQPDWTKEGGKYVPFPATYVNAARWEDEPPNGSRSTVPARTQGIIDVMESWGRTKTGGA